MTTPPQIRYAKTSDGVNIAYYAIGSGQPIVYVPAAPLTHVELEWRVEDVRAAMERTARNNMLVRYDARGFGLSDRDATDFSLEAMVRDLEAVVDALNLFPAVIMSGGSNSVTALAYASRHPERVAALVLREGVARGRDGWDEDLYRLVRTNFPLFKQLLVGALRFPNESSARRMEHLMEEAATQDNCIAFYDAIAFWDATDLLPYVTTPTLVLHRRGEQMVSGEACRRLAAALPNCTFTTLEGSAFAFTDPASGEALRSFLSAHVPRPATSAALKTESPGGVRTILFTDIVGHTEMMQRLGDAKGREVLREHERITRETLKQFGGTEIKTDGDSFMVSFGSVTQAIDCAIALQRAFAAHTESMPEPLHVRVGLNAGEPIEEDGDLFGSTVILASRIAAQAGAGEILIPEPLRHLLSGKNYVYADRGETMLKGFETAVRLYEVRWRSDG